jgi:pre-mRNA cleavage complex 2 protein Pcf11
MDMYSRVGAATRRDMDFILRTWKEPPQGSRDPQPVLPVDITRQIENALIRFRTISFQQNQQQTRGRAPAPCSTDKAGYGPPAQAPTGNGPAAPETAEYMTTLQQRPGTNINSGAAYQPPQSVRSPVPQTVLPVAPSLPVSYNGAQPNYGAQQQLSQMLQSKLQSETKQLIDVLTLQKVLAVGPPNLEIDQLHATLDALMKVLNSGALVLSHLQTVQAELIRISERVQRGLPPELAMLIKGASQSTLPAQAPVPTTQLNPLAALLTATPYPMHSSSTPPPLARLPPTTTLPQSTAYSLPAAAAYSAPPAFAMPAFQPPGGPPAGGELDLIAQLQAAGLLPPANPAPKPSTHGAGGRFGVRLDQDSIMKPYVIQKWDHETNTSGSVRTSSRSCVATTSRTSAGSAAAASRQRRRGSKPR